MADFSLPTTSSFYTDMISILKDRDVDIATMFRTAATNVPANAIRWEPTNRRFEVYDGVSAWAELQANYAISADKLGGKTAASFLNTTDTFIKTGGSFNLEANLANPIKIKGGAADHVYIELYADAASQTTRSGYFGFGAAASLTLNINNERLDGDIKLQTNHATAYNGRVSINNNIYLDNGHGNVSNASDILFTSSGLIAAQDSLYFNIDSNNTTTGSSFYWKINAETSAGTELMSLNESGRLGVTGYAAITASTTPSMYLNQTGNQYHIHLRDGSAERWAIGAPNTLDNFRIYSYGTASDAFTIDYGNGNMVTLNNLAGGGTSLYLTANSGAVPGAIRFGSTPTNSFYMQGDNNGNLQMFDNSFNTPIFTFTQAGAFILRNLGGTNNSGLWITPPASDGTDVSLDASGSTSGNMLLKTSGTTRLQLTSGYSSFTNSLIANDTFEVKGVTTARHIYPYLTDSYDLGINGKRWATIHVNDVHIGSADHIINQAGSNEIQYQSANTGNAYFRLKASDGVVRGGLRADSDNTIALVAGSSTSYVVAHALNGDTTFYSGGVEKARITSAGIMSVASGIKFPATQAPSSDVNTLDDYEEGTWTPNVGGTASYYNADGVYVKIGNKVFFYGRITINVLGTGNTYTISGLPFAVSSSMSSGVTPSVTIGDYGGLSVAVSELKGSMNYLGNILLLSSTSATHTTLSGNSVLKDGSYVYFSGIYEAAN